MRERRINEYINDINESMKFSKRKLNDINDINESMKKSPTPRVTRTEWLADKLVEIYKAPQSRQFFLKCAWHLSEDTIWSAVEDSRKKGVRSAIALFIFICNNALKETSIES